MKYQESGRFGRITKHLRKLGFEQEMEKILFDSSSFPKLKKTEHASYVEKVVTRMTKIIGEKNTEKVLFECGAQCCGKSWSKFVMNIWRESESLEIFFRNLNQEEEKYNTLFTHIPSESLIIVERTKCICGLINKGEHFQNNKNYCKCSTGHMSVFFKTIFDVKDIQLTKSIYSGSDRCEWKIKIQNDAQPIV